MIRSTQLASLTAESRKVDMVFMEWLRQEQALHIPVLLVKLILSCLQECVIIMKTDRVLNVV